VGLRALERCADVLKHYSIVIYAAGPDVVMAAELFTDKTGVSVTILPSGTPHHEILSFHAQARISIGLSISDAISTSLLEAMVMGSFPIQSCTACADEWVQHGVSASIVPPEDSAVIETAIRTALADDDLVNRASQINWQVAQTRLDRALLKGKAIQMYRDIMA
jgi:glycosyltransferase involved in cell wall biosynthesis